MIKFVVCVIFASVVHARLLRKRQTPCPEVCDGSRCPVAPESRCYYGVVKDSCGCCTVCASGEGDICGERGIGLCGEGMTCEYPAGKRRMRGLCVCTLAEPVCGSDGRTYPSMCRLRAENKIAELSINPPVILIQKGHCDSGEYPSCGWGPKEANFHRLHLLISSQPCKEAYCYQDISLCLCIFFMYFLRWITGLYNPNCWINRLYSPNCWITGLYRPNYLSSWPNMGICALLQCVSQAACSLHPVGIVINLLSRKAELLLL